MLRRIGQKATMSKIPSTTISTRLASKEGSSEVRGRAGATARSNSAGVSIVVVILASAIPAQIVVGEHRSEQRNTIRLDALIGLHRTLPVRDATAQHQNDRVRQRRDDARVG